MIKFILLTIDLSIKFLIFNKNYILFAFVALVVYILIDSILSINGVNTPIKKLYKIMK